MVFVLLTERMALVMSVLGDKMKGLIHNFFISMLCLIRLYLSIVRLYLSGKCRGGLPLLTVLTSVLYVVYAGLVPLMSWWMKNNNILHDVKSSSLYYVSHVVIMGLVSFQLLGYTVFYLLFRNAILRVFNRVCPDCFSDYFKFQHVFLEFLLLLKPIEVLLRALTYRFRVLPDVLILGEVRCGTTTLTQQLSNYYNIDSKVVHPPFCLWVHPELDKKESFYFVGHYLRVVAPSFYRMCFPLKLTKWFYSNILGRPFITFDACAQYLTSPSAPYLIAEAYKKAKQPPPVLIVCVRDPIDQTVSWWKYENLAMEWGESGLGLRGCAWNTRIRSDKYPPRCIADAIEYSQSSIVQGQFIFAEGVQRKPDLFHNRFYKLHPWEMTWPGGQLGVIGTTGKYYTNIQRYEKEFQKQFDDFNTTAPMSSSVTSSLKFVNVLTIEDLQEPTTLSSFLDEILCKIENRHRLTAEVVGNTPAVQFCKKNFGKLKRRCSQRLLKVDLRRNASLTFTSVEDILTQDDFSKLKNLFSSDKKALEDACNRKFNWAHF